MTTNDRATRRVGDAITATTRLAQVVAEENAALRESRWTDVRALAEEKAAAARNYETKVQAILDVGRALDEVDAGLRQRLRGMGERADALMAENASLLRVSSEATRRLVEAFADAARELAPRAQTYSRAGAMGGGRGASAASVSLDRSL